MSNTNYQIILLLFIILSVVFVSGNKIQEGYDRKFDYTASKGRLDKFEAKYAKYPEIVDAIMDAKEKLRDYDICKSTGGDTAFMTQKGILCTGSGNTASDRETALNVSIANITTLINNFKNAGANYPGKLDNNDILSMSGTTNLSRYSNWDNPIQVTADDYTYNDFEFKGYINGTTLTVTTRPTQDKQLTEGDYITGTGVNPNTKIVAIVTDTTGSYTCTVSPSQTVGAMTNPITMRARRKIPMMHPDNTNFKTTTLAPGYINLKNDIKSHLENSSRKVKQRRADLDNKMSELYQVGSSTAADNARNMDSTAYASILWTVTATALIGYLITTM